MSHGGYRKKWIKKDDKQGGEEEAPEAEPEAPTGPSYGQGTMLRLYEVFKKKGIPNEFKLGYSTEDRPAEAEAGEATPGAAREALREVLKDRRQAKRQASGSFSGATPTAAAALTPKAGTPTGFPGMPMQPMFPMMPQGIAPMQYWCPLWGSEATMRLSNVPSGYKQETLAALLGVRFRGAIDFLYLPPAQDGAAESVNNCTYAWVNFRSQQAVHDFKTSFNNVRAGTAFPGSEPAAEAEAAESGDKSADKTCKVQKAKIQQLDKLIAEVRKQASTGQSVRMPILWDLYGNVRPIPTADAHSAAAAAAAAATAAAMSAAAFSGNTYGAQIRQQIEYYFSFDNMCRDVFLRSKMDEEGWVPMSLISGFNKIKQFGVAPESLGTYLTGSEVVEVDAEKKRLRQLDAKQRMIWELKGNLDGQDASKDAKAEDAKA